MWGTANISGILYAKEPTFLDWLVQEKCTFQQKAKGYTFVCSIFLFLTGNA